MAQTAPPLEPYGIDEPLVCETRSAIGLLTLNRPNQRNALSEALLDGLLNALRALSESREIKAIVLTGNGPVFCAGHDLNEMTSHRGDSDRGKTYYANIMGKCSAMMQALVCCPKPVIAAVQGTATAAGCQLVASCDLAVASENAAFCTPGVHIGFFCSTPMVALSRNVARKHAMEMLLLGEQIDAERACQMGLINRVVPASDLLDETLRMGARVADKSSAIVAIGKEAFYSQIEMPLSQAYDYANEVMVANMLHGDAEEGIGAFLEKRPPKWRND